LKNHSTKYHRQQPLYNTLELLMMGIVMPETCWASNKICNKKPMLHLVGILFPHNWRIVTQSNICATWRLGNVSESLSLSLFVCHAFVRYPTTARYNCKSLITIVPATVSLLTKQTATMTEPSTRNMTLIV